MGKYPQGKVKLYEVQINHQTVGFIAEQNKWDAVVKIVRSFGFVNLYDYIDRYPGKFDPKSVFSHENIAWYGRDPNTYRPDSFDVAYDHYFNVFVLYDKNHHTDYSKVIEYRIERKKDDTPTLYPTLKEAKQTVPLRKATHNQLWFCSDWSDPYE